MTATPIGTIYQARRQAVPLEMRIVQIRKCDKLNGTAARCDVVEVDRARTGRITVMFDTDGRDPSRYDLVVNLVRVTPDETTHLILNGSGFFVAELTLGVIQSMRSSSAQQRPQAARVGQFLQLPDRVAQFARF